MRRWPILFGSLFCCFTLSCQTPNVNATDLLKIQTTSSVQNEALQFELDGQNLSAQELNDFIVQSFGKNKFSFNRGNQQRQNNDVDKRNTIKNQLKDKFKNISKRIKGKLKQHWYQYARHTRGWYRAPDLVLDEVLLTDTGERVSDADAPAAIIPDFAGTQIRLSLKGTFKNRWRGIPLKRFLYSYEDGLVHQSFIGQQPQARVLLDHSILLQVESVTENEIVARLDTTAIPDLYLKGLHRISVEYGNYYTDGLVNVGDPVHVDNLAPSIESAEIIYDRRNRPAQILLKGQNYMVFPKFYYATIDGEFGFGYQTEVFEDGHFETSFHIPDPKNFDVDAEHVVIFATPFGVAFYEL